jgi:ribosomal protein S18 acetylase RimI-like enzyme
MEKISFRTATVGDWDFIEHLSARVFSIFGDYGEILPQWLLQPGVIVLIGSRDERKMGFAMVRLGERKVEDAPAGELLAIAVMPEYQRRGLGKALLGRVEDLALQYGLGELHLHTARDNLSARCLFHKTGYRAARMKKSYYPKGQSAVMMVKKLSP